MEWKRRERKQQETIEEMKERLCKTLVYKCYTCVVKELLWQLRRAKPCDYCIVCRVSVHVWNAWVAQTMVCCTLVFNITLCARLGHLATKPHDRGLLGRYQRILLTLDLRSCKVFMDSCWLHVDIIRHKCITCLREAVTKSKDASRTAFIIH